MNVEDGIKEEVTWCFWFGGEFPPKRQNCFNSITNLNKNVILITENNINELVKDGCSFHKGFEYLSATHKSDYLRSYTMLNYGGAYADIKLLKRGWNEYFSEVYESETVIGLGYPEARPEDIARNKKTEPFLSEFKNFVGASAFMYKKQTAFTQKWFKETQTKMDHIFDELKVHSGSYDPCATRNGAHRNKNILSQGYPLGWNELLGQIYHPLVYEFREYIVKNFPRPIFNPRSYL